MYLQSILTNCERIQMWVHPKVQFFLTMDHFDKPFTKKNNHEAFNNYPNRIIFYPIWDYGSTSLLPSIKTGFTLGEPVSLMKVFRLFRLEQNFFFGV